MLGPPHRRSPWVAYRANLGTLLRTCDAAGACMAVPDTPHYHEALAVGDTLMGGAPRLNVVGGRKPRPVPARGAVVRPRLGPSPHSPAGARNLRQFRFEPTFSPSNMRFQRSIWTFEAGDADTPHRAREACGRSRPTRAPTCTRWRRSSCASPRRSATPSCTPTASSAAAGRWRSRRGGPTATSASTCATAAPACGAARTAPGSASGCRSSARRRSTSTSAPTRRAAPRS